MANIIRARSPHAQKLERWCTAGEVERISASMRGWYGPPILVAGTPGPLPLYATGDGDFVGFVAGGGFASMMDRARDVVRRAARRQATTMNAGFSSLSDLISEATNGKRQEISFLKNGTAGTQQGTSSLWRCAGMPGAGSAAAAAPGGTVPTSATTGAMPLRNPASGDTTHYVSATGVANASNTLLLYDRLFAVAKTMNSTATEAVTGVPTRYQSTTPGDPNYAGGNFLFVECGSVLPATAHDWTECQYTDQDGNTGQVLPSLTGNASCQANRIDHPLGQWFAPLAAGDSGIKALTQMQCSALVATGTIDFVIGRPLAWMPLPTAQVTYLFDGINTAFNLARIFDDACLALLEPFRFNAGAVNYTGQVTLVSG